jgi:hypothetical protein
MEIRKKYKREKRKSPPQMIHENVHWVTKLKSLAALMRLQFITVYRSELRKKERARKTEASLNLNPSRSGDDKNRDLKKLDAEES